MYAIFPKPGFYYDSWFTKERYRKKSVIKDMETFLFYLEEENFPDICSSE